MGVGRSVFKHSLESRLGKTVVEQLLTDDGEIEFGGKGLLFAHLKIEPGDPFDGIELAARLEPGRRQHRPIPGLQELGLHGQEFVGVELHQNLAGPDPVARSDPQILDPSRDDRFHGQGRSRHPDDLTHNPLTVAETTLDHRSDHDTRSSPLLGVKFDHIRRHRGSGRHQDQSHRDPTHLSPPRQKPGRAVERSTNHRA